MEIDYLNKAGVAALWEKIKSTFALKSSFNTHVGSMNGTIAELQVRISLLEDRIAALESGGGGTITPEESAYGVVNTDNHIVVNDTYTTLRYVDDGENAISNVTDIE